MKKTQYEKQSLQDQVVLVTGGNSGIGYYTVLKALQEGAHVIMASRSLQRAEDAKLSLKKQTSIDRLTILELDVSSLDSVHSFVATFFISI